MDALDARIQALTPEQMLDTSGGDAEAEQNAKFADALHQEALARGDEDTIELERLSKETRQEVADKEREARKTGKDSF